MYLTKCHPAELQGAGRHGEPHLRGWAECPTEDGRWGVGLAWDPAWDQEALRGQAVQDGLRGLGQHCGQQPHQLALGDACKPSPVRRAGTGAGLHSGASAVCEGSSRDTSLLFCSVQLIWGAGSRRAPASTLRTGALDDCSDSPLGQRAPQGPVQAALEVLPGLQRVWA